MKMLHLSCSFTLQELIKIVANYLISILLNNNIIYFQPVTWSDVAYLMSVLEIYDLLLWHYINCMCCIMWYINTAYKFFPSCFKPINVIIFVFNKVNNTPYDFLVYSIRI